MALQIAATEAEIAACFAVMRELRSDINQSDFIQRIQRQQRSGYQLGFIQDAEGVVAVAGYRFGESLAWGRYVYVDDLVTSSSHRSKGYGQQLLQEIRMIAKSAGCEQLHLDSGLQRTDAHRFYEREGMNAVAMHFTVEI